MNHVDNLLAERKLSPLRLRFTGQLENQYRLNLRRQLKYPRAFLFLILALGFGASPLQEQSLFNAPEHLRGALALVAWLVSPIAVAAAMLSFFPSSPRQLAQGVQTAAVVVIFSAAFSLRHLALTSSFQYPAAMLGIVIVAVAIFGSFSAYRLIPAMLLFYVAGIVQEVYYLNRQSVSELPAYVLFYFLLISVAGAYTNEILRRQSWIQRRAADALARIDILTGLTNQNALNELYQTAFNQARRQKAVLAVLLLDIDHFKRLNDTHGHLAGDDALRLVGPVLAKLSAQRPLDICARFGGEEFVVVWFDVNPDALVRLATALLDAIRAIELTMPGREEPYKITASAGLTWLTPTGESSPERVLAKADTLMYRAKDAGRDQLVLEAFEA